MNKIFLVPLCLLLGIGLSQAQSDDLPRESKINEEIQRALTEVEKSLDELNLEDIDLQEILDQVKEALPTKEEMAKHQDHVTSALKDVVREIKKIDFTELEKALQEIGSMFEDTESKNPEDSGVRKI